MLRLEQIEADPYEQRPGARHPERIRAWALGVQDIRDPLNVVDAPVRRLRHVRETVPACGIAIGCERLEPKAGLAPRRAKTGGNRPVFPFNIDLDQGSRPVE